MIENFLGFIKTLPIKEIKDLTIIASILIGGIWTYYKFIRGRLFSVRMEVRLLHSLLPTQLTHEILTIELVVENIGATRIRPKKYLVQIHGLTIENGNLKKEQVMNETDLLPSPSPSPKFLGFWYIEPGEKDYRTKAIALENSKYAVLKVDTIVEYNMGRRTHRNFHLDLTNKPNSTST